MDKLLEIMPIIMLALGQLVQSMIIIQHRREIDALWDLPKYLLESREEDNHGTER